MATPGAFLPLFAILDARCFAFSVAIALLWLMGNQVCNSLDLLAGVIALKFVPRVV